MEFPGDLRFCPSHEWVRVNDDGTITVGISEFAQQQLGDLVYVETPEIDLQCEAEEGVAVIESVKAASDIYAPVTGKILDTNAKLTDSPELINSDSYGEGWIFSMLPNDVADVEQLMGPDDYQAFTEESDD